MQGSFALHIESLKRCGVEPVQIKRAHQLEGLSGIILPGGESTTFHVVMSEDNLLIELKKAVGNGLPAWGTCAGAIMLGRGAGIPERWNLIGIEVARNAFGRQIDSFVSPLNIRGFDHPFDGVFIRAPRFTAVDPKVEILAEYSGEPVMASQRSILVTSFHPELTGDDRVHRLFLDNFCTRNLN